MAISASVYRKIQSIKTWATNKLPTVSEDTYTDLLTDLLKYLDDLITNNDFFETDIQVIIDELNKLLNMTFPTEQDINKAIQASKTEITKEYTNAINSAKSELTTSYTKAIEASEKTLNASIGAVDSKLDTTKTTLQSNINATSAKIDTTMNAHKRISKTPSLVLWKIFLRRVNICQ